MDKFINIEQQLTIELERIEKATVIDKASIEKEFIETGYKYLDFLLDGGFYKGEITLVHGAVLKTTFIWNLIKQISESERRKNRAIVYFSSHHMSKDLALRYINPKFKISMHNLKKGTVEMEDFGSLIDSIDSVFGDNNVYISNPLGKDFTPEYINLVCEEIKAIENLKPQLIIVDSLNHMKIQKGEKNYDRYEQYMFELRDIARERNAAIVVTSNTVKDVGNRANKRPQKDDVFLSSYINHFCKDIISLYFDTYYDRYSSHQNELEVCVQKIHNSFAVTFSVDPDSFNIYQSSS